MTHAPGQEYLWVELASGSVGQGLLGGDAGHELLPVRSLCVSDRQRIQRWTFEGHWLQAVLRQLQRMGAQGEFAIAYVIAHEVAHHVQNLEGLLSASRSNQMSVQTELQADCLAGIWANHARDERGRIVLNETDIQSGISAAAAVGDDAIQRGAGQAVRPESFTHGSSQQRVDAFVGGYRSGDYRVCFS